MKPLNLEPNAVWKQRFRAPRIAWASAARNTPERGLVCTNRSGIFQLYAWNVAAGDLRQATDGPAGKDFGVIASNGRWIWYLDDKDGSEIGHFVRVPFEGGEPQNMTPDLSPYSSFFIADSRDSAHIGLTASASEGHGCYIIDVGPDDKLGEPRQLARFERLAIGPMLSYGGEVAVIATTERSSGLSFSLRAYDAATKETIGELAASGESSIEPVTFSPIAGDTRLLAKTSESGFARPLIWNTRTGERRDLLLPELEGDVTPWDWSPDGRFVLLAQLNRAVHQLHLYDLETDTVKALSHPPGTYTDYFQPGYFMPGGEIFTLLETSVRPRSLVALDQLSGNQTRIVLSAGNAPESRLWRSVSFPSSDGALIQAWVATPKGEGPFPTVLDTHGGPSAVMMELFSPKLQAWLDHGFAICSINYHGSTTFGREFEQSIWGKLGKWETEDMAAAHAWLVENGVAQADAILLTGWSYGGYLTLFGLGKRPDLWAGGMAGIAIADWAMMYEDSAETLRGYQRGLFKGTPEETPDAHRESSPITYAENVTAPLLVIQGRNDTRCPARQMESYEARLTSLGKSIQVEWFDAGHGSLDTEQMIHDQETMMRFAYRVLG